MIKDGGKTVRQTSGIPPLRTTPDGTEVYHELLLQPVRKRYHYLDHRHHSPARSPRELIGGNQSGGPRKRSARFCFINPRSRPRSERQCPVIRITVRGAHVRMLSITMHTGFEPERLRALTISNGLRRVCASHSQTLRRHSPAHATHKKIRGDRSTSSPPGLPCRSRAGTSRDRRPFSASRARGRCSSR